MLLSVWLIISLYTWYLIILTLIIFLFGDGSHLDILWGTAFTCQQRWWGYLVIFTYLSSQYLVSVKMVLKFDQLICFIQFSSDLVKFHYRYLVTIIVKISIYVWNIEVLCKKIKYARLYKQHKVVKNVGNYCL